MGKWNSRKLAALVVALGSIVGADIPPELAQSLVAAVSAVYILVQGIVDWKELEF